MLGEISFCDKLAYNIKLDDTKHRILQDLEQQFRFKVIQKHHDTYSDTCIHKLNSNPHMIGIRTNGNPYLLYLTRLNFVNQCIFIDKKVQQGYFLPRIIISKFRFDDDLFEGTLFDGEMVKDKDGNWIYVISDIIGYTGNYLENVNLIKRLNILYNLFEKQYTQDVYDVCYFQIKRYVRYDQLDTLVNDFIPNLKYSCRGIYFKPLFLKFKDILVNFDDTLIQKVMRKKYKTMSNFLLMEDKDKLDNLDITRNEKIVQSQTSVSGKTNKFEVRKTSQPDVYILQDIRNNNPETNACIPTLRVSKMMRAIFADKNVSDKVSMVCEYSDKFGKWIPSSIVQP